MRRKDNSKGDRLRVAVLMGGPSAEHDVSMAGGANVVSALQRGLFHVRPVVITRQGTWYIAPRKWESRRQQSGRQQSGRQQSGRSDAVPSPFDSREYEGWREYPGTCEGLVALREWPTDVVIPQLHGHFGEDGTIQACLTAAGIPFVGSDAAASAAAFDKVRAKEVFKYHGIDTPEFDVLERADFTRGRRDRIAAWIKRFGLPLVLKNPRGGSTIEVRLAKDAREALAALEDLAPSAERLMVEEHVAGRELTVGVIDDREAGGPVALPIVEIKSDFFDYDAKYSEQGAEEICPADIPDEVADRARAIGLAIHRILGLRGLSRTDVMLTDGGALRVLEVNTLPGMTDRGLVPLAAREHGVGFPALIEGLVHSARLPGA